MTEVGDTGEPYEVRYTLRDGTERVLTWATSEDRALQIARSWTAITGAPARVIARRPR